MDFSLTNEQKMFRETIYRYGRDEIAPLCEEADLRGEFSYDIAAIENAQSSIMP